MKRVYQIWDKKSETYQVPMIFSHHPDAIRELEYVVNGERPSMLQRHPDDYELRYMGDFDCRTGIIEYAKNPELVCELSNLKKIGGKNEISNIA